MNKHPNINRVLKAQKQRGVNEYNIHCAIASYLNTAIKRPSRWWTIEVSNQSSGKAAMLRQIGLKKKGVVTGTPDIMIMWRHKYGTLSSLIFLEVKVPGGKLTEKQEALHKELREDGHHVHVVHSVDEVIIILKELGVC